MTEHAVSATKPNSGLFVRWPTVFKKTREHRSGKTQAEEPIIAVAGNAYKRPESDATSLAARSKIENAISNQRASLFICSLRSFGG